MQPIWEFFYKNVKGQLVALITAVNPIGGLPGLDLEEGGIGRIV
jgi:hypothetical protein